MLTINNYSSASKIVPAKEWFGSGVRLPYDPVTKSILNPDMPATEKSLFIFDRYLSYPKQNPNNLISFLPGYPFGSYDWAKIDALLEEQKLNRLFVEYIGQGDSDKPEDYPYSTFERADQVEAIWKYHGVTATFAVTFDYSSLVVMELLRRQQEK